MARIRHGALSLSIISSFLLAWLLSHLVDAEPDRLVRARQQRQGLEIEIGARLYSQNCGTCHGPRGEGVGQLGPPLSDRHFFTARLAEVGWLATLEEYVSSATEHGRMMGTRPIYAGNGSTAVMPPWHQNYGGPLRGDQIRALTAFVMNWRATATGQVTLIEIQEPKLSSGDPALVEKGRAVFTEHCSGCHAYRTSTPDLVAGPDLASLDGADPSRYAGLSLEEYLRESVLIPMARVAEEYRALSAEHPCGALLSESELTAVATFLLQ